MKDSEQIRSIIGMMKNILQFLKAGQLGAENYEAVELSIADLNKTFYSEEKLKDEDRYDFSREREASINQLGVALARWEKSLERRSGNRIDEEFWSIYEYFKYVDKEDIYKTVVKHFLSLQDEYKEEYKTLPKRYTFLTGKIDYTEGDYSLIRQHVDMMSERVEDYKWLYSLLSDWRSKAVLNGIVRYWFEFDINRLHLYTENIFSDYYDFDILKELPKDAVMVDLGAYVGDSLLSYIYNYGSYGKIYAYEITEKTFEKLKTNTAMLHNIVLRHCGVGAETGSMYCEVEGGEGNCLAAEGSMKVDVVTLDEDIIEKIDIIKMDIEGAEKDALLGADGHIRNEKPQLLISAYHIPDDIFEIPKMVADMRDDYRFYLRLNGRGIWPCDYVLLCI